MATPYVAMQLSSWIWQQKMMWCSYINLILKPLKTYFFQEAKNWMVQIKERKLLRTIARLIGTAWGISVTVANATSDEEYIHLVPKQFQIISFHFRIYA